MGKTKQAEKKFDRNVEISAPILDPEIIRAIHSPPKDQRIDVRHGGFRALLSDLNSQDSTDELTPITEPNHLPSYIGISCAVSGYSSYSSYGSKKLSGESEAGEKQLREHQQDSTNRVTAHKLAASSQVGGQKSHPQNRSHTNSPVAVLRPDQPNIHHVTIDKSHMNTIEQERRELTEKLTASATESRHRSPSPIPPTEDDRHHGAYVGARYFPMPEPSRAVQKHIPLLGIDDEVDPDEVVPDDVNKVEHKIASLYGDEFAGDWKESMAHKAKKEHSDEELGLEPGERSGQTEKKNPKDLVTLKPTPPKPAVEEVAPREVPTPNIKVLEGVEKQFLNRLLTDENPPKPRSPSPQHTGIIASPPVSPKLIAREVAPREQVLSVSHTVAPAPVSKQQNLSIQESPVAFPTPAAVQPAARSPSPPLPPQALERHESPVARSPSPPPPVQQAESPLVSPVHQDESIEAAEEKQETITARGESPARSPTPPSQEAPPTLEPVVAVEELGEVEQAPTHIELSQEAPQELVVSEQQELAQEAGSHESTPEPLSLIDVSAVTTTHQEEAILPDLVEEPELSLPVHEEESRCEEVQDLLEISDDFDGGETGTVEEPASVPQSPTNDHDAADPASRPDSPSSQVSSSTVERAPMQAAAAMATAADETQHDTQHSGDLTTTTSEPPRQAQEAPALDLAADTQAHDESSLVTATDIVTSQESDNLVSFSPEPPGLSETNNNNIEPAQAKQVSEQVPSDLLGDLEPAQVEEEKEVAEKYSPELASIQEAVESGVSGDMAAPTSGATEEGKLDGHHFLDLLKVEESFIMEQVRKAEAKLAEHEAVWDEDQLGRVHSAIGKANLLINKKCNQFKGLCEQSLASDGKEQYAVLSDDLAGFWDMISIQIADVRKSFENL